MRATFRMIPAHGTYVAPRLLHAAEQAYLQRNNKKKRETPVESSNPIKGDDPWPTSRIQAPRATSSRTNLSVSAPAFSVGWRMRFMYRAVEREIARYLQNSRFTYETEREIERRFFR